MLPRLLTLALVGHVAASSCRCATDITTRPGTRFGVGCAAHDERVALPCTLVPKGKRFLATRTGHIENAPYCSRRWCYVENPSECMASNGSVRTAHMSAYDTNGDLVSDSFLGWMTYGNYHWPFVKGNAGIPFYSYEACGELDLYTTPAQKSRERLFLNGLEASFYVANSYGKLILLNQTWNWDKGYNVAMVPKRCTMPDGKFYPWDATHVVDSLARRGANDTLVTTYSPLSPEWFGTYRDTYSFKSVRDGEDGFFPVYCHAPSTRLIEFGLSSREPASCYTRDALFDDFYSGQYPASLLASSGRGGWYVYPSFYSYDMCGFRDTISPVVDRYAYKELGAFLLGSHENWQPVATPLSTEVLHNLSVASPEEVRLLTSVVHVDDCAHLCAGTPSCHEWAYEWPFANAPHMFAEKYASIVWNGTRVKMVVSADERTFALDTVDTTPPQRLLKSPFQSRWVNTAYQSVGDMYGVYKLELDYLRNATNGTLELLLRLASPSENMTDYCYETASKTCLSENYIALATLDNEYIARVILPAVNGSCWMMSAKASSEAAVRTPLGSASAFAGRGAMTLDAKHAPPAQTLRSAAIRFFRHTSIGKWLRDTVFPENEKYEFETRRSSLASESLLYLNERETRRIDSPQRVGTLTPVADAVLRMVVEMRIAKGYVPRRVLHNLLDVRDLSVYTCVRGYATDGIDGCPSEIRKVDVDPNVQIQRVYQHDRVGIANDPDEPTVASMVRDRCGEVSSALVAYNHTDAFIVLKDTEYLNFQTTTNYFEKDGKWCSSPYLTGRVHCGALKTAMRALSRILQASDVSSPDLCHILLQVPCPRKLKWHFGGFSIGAGAGGVMIAWLDTYLSRHYGIDLRAEEVSIDLFGFPYFGDREFVDAFLERWGSSLDLYTDRADTISALTNAIALSIGATAENVGFSDARGHVVSAIGSCGFVTEKKLKECWDTCSFGADFEAEACIGFIQATLLSTPQAHENLPYLLLPDDEIPEVVKEKKQNVAYNSLSAAIDILQGSLGYISRTFGSAPPFSTCLESYWEETGVTNVCVDEIRRHGWQYNPFLHSSRMEVGKRVAWCMQERQRLQKRNGDTRSWDRICCDLEHVHDRNTTRVDFTFARPAITGNEG